MPSNERYLEITYHAGRAVAAYLYLPRIAEDRAARSRKWSEDVVIDFAADGRAIGIEILSLAHATVASLNSALASVGQPPVTVQESAPLLAA